MTEYCITSGSVGVVWWDTDRSKVLFKVTLQHSEWTLAFLYIVPSLHGSSCSKWPGTCGTSLFPNSCTYRPLCSLTAFSASSPCLYTTNAIPCALLQEQNKKCRHCGCDVPPPHQAFWLGLVALGTEFGEHQPCWRTWRTWPPITLETMEHRDIYRSTYLHRPTLHKSAMVWFSTSQTDGPRRLVESCDKDLECLRLRFSVERLSYTRLDFPQKSLVIVCWDFWFVVINNRSSFLPGNPHINYGSVIVEFAFQFIFSNSASQISNEYSVTTVCAIEYRHNFPIKASIFNKIDPIWRLHTSYHRERSVFSINFFPQKITSTQ